MRILVLSIILLTSSSIFGQIDGLETSTGISMEEARNIAKREGYLLKSTKLDSNQWIIVYSKCVGYASSISPVYKNVSTTIDASTGKVKKRSRYNSLGFGELANDRVPRMQFERRKRMRVWGEKITVYY